MIAETRLYLGVLFLGIFSFQLHADELAALEVVETPAPACFGKNVESLEIPQFSDENAEQYSGTCYSWASAAAVESAYFRKSGEKIIIPKLLPAAAECSLGNDSVERMKSRLADTTSEMTDNLKVYSQSTPLSGGFGKTSIERILALGQISKNNETTRLQTQAFLSKLEDITLDYGKEFLTVKAQIQKIDREDDELRRAAEALELKIALIDKKFEDSLKDNPPPDIRRNLVDTHNRESALGLKNADEIAAKINASFDKIIALRNKAKLIAEEKATLACDTGKCFIEDVKKIANDDPSQKISFSGMRARELPFAEYAKDKKESTPCNQKANERAVEEIMRSLCLGMPLELEIDIKHFYYMEGNKTLQASSRNGAHAVVLAGLENFDGKVFFKLRDSGTSPTVSYLPIENACKATSAMQVYNTQKLEGENVSEGMAYLSSVTRLPETEEERDAARLMELRRSKKWLNIKFSEGEKKVNEENLDHLTPEANESSSHEL